MAVYTVVEPEVLAAFLKTYDLGDLIDVAGITEGVENSNYRLTTEHGRFILTLYERRVDAGDLPFFLGLMDHLAARGVPSPVPIKDREDRTLRDLCGRPAAITTYLEGRSPHRIDAVPHCRALGAALARLHLAGRGFGLERRNDLSVTGWRQLQEACRRSDDGSFPGLVAELEDELTHIEAAWPRDLPGGVIHADLFPDNVFFSGPALTGMFDFYFACNDLFAYDLAVCLNAWCFEADGAFNVTKARWLLAAYRNIRPFTAQELEALPLLARGASLRFLLTRLYDWQNQVEGALVRPKDPLEYLHKLRFHRDVKDPAAYGLD